MSETLSIKPATRQGVKPLIGLYGKSGGGKTRSALLLARGIAGPTGRVVLVDTENRRGEIFADVIPGGYEVIQLSSPFGAERYEEAVNVAVSGGAACVVVDSLTHQWDGEGGVLERHESELDRMAGDDWKKRDACSPRAWNLAKAPHKRFVYGTLLRLPVPLICCLRAQEKLQMNKGDNGKMAVKMADRPAPIYDPRFIFEMLINGEVYSRDGVGGFLRVEKITHEGLFSALPKDGEQIGIAHGEAIARWCASAGKPAAQDQTKPLKQKLWELMDKKPLDKIEEQLAGWKIIGPGERISGMTVEELTVVLEKVEIQLQQP